MGCSEPVPARDRSATAAPCGARHDDHPDEVEGLPRRRAAGHGAGGLRPIDAGVEDEKAKRGSSPATETPATSTAGVSRRTARTSSSVPWLRTVPATGAPERRSRGRDPRGAYRAGPRLRPEAGRQRRARLRGPRGGHPRAARSRRLRRGGGRVGRLHRRRLDPLGGHSGRLDPRGRDAGGERARRLHPCRPPGRGDAGAGSGIGCQDAGRVCREGATGEFRPSEFRPSTLRPSAFRPCFVRLCSESPCASTASAFPA